MVAPRVKSKSEFSGAQATTAPAPKRGNATAGFDENARLKNACFELLNPWRSNQLSHFLRYARTHSGVSQFENNLSSLFRRSRFAPTSSAFRSSAEISVTGVAACRGDKSAKKNPAKPPRHGKWHQPGIFDFNPIIRFTENRRLIDAASSDKGALPTGIGQSIKSLSLLFPTTATVPASTAFLRTEEANREYRERGDHDANSDDSLPVHVRTPEVCRIETPAARQYRRSRS